MDFIEARLLDKVSYGTQAGIAYRTEIKTLASGHERRAQKWTRPLARFGVVYKNLRPEDREEVVRAFRACAGRARGFRMRDPLDWTAVREPLGIATGDPQIIQLYKSYTFGPIVEIGPIYKPVLVTVYADEDVIAATVDNATGLITVTATAGAELSWSGTFDKPVRFDNDDLMWSVDAREGWTSNRIASTDVSLTEIRV